MVESGKVKQQYTNTIAQDKYFGEKLEGFEYEASGATVPKLVTEKECPSAEKHQSF